MFSDHLNLHTVELRRWTHPEGPLASADQWVYFLREAAFWEKLPADLQTPEMIKAMATLNRIFDKKEDYLRYQARENYLREQRALEKERRALEAELAEERAALEQERAAREQERAAHEQERAAREQALAEVDLLKARLRALGVEPD